MAALSCAVSACHGWYSTQGTVEHCWYCGRNRSGVHELKSVGRESSGIGPEVRRLTSKRPKVVCHVADVSFGVGSRIAWPRTVYARTCKVS